jgi:hypothetical protein
MWALLALSTAIGAMQGAHWCDYAHRVHDPCIGVAIGVPFCGPPLTDLRIRSIAVDGVPVPVAGPLVRYGYNQYGQHLEAPNDLSATGQVLYFSSTPILFQTVGGHTVTITYGPTPTTVSVLMKAVSEVGDITGTGTITICPSAALQHGVR